MSRSLLQALAPFPDVALGPAQEAAGEEGGDSLPRPREGTKQRCTVILYFSLN